MLDKVHTINNITEVYTLMICGGSVLPYSNRQLMCLLDSSYFECMYMRC